MTKQVELIAFLFDGQAHMLSDELTEWMEESPRFTDFADIYRDKIRKKIRVASQPEGILDLRGELDVAFRLLSDRRLEVKYEPYASMKKRGADFAVSYRKNLVFNIEVARIRESKTTGFRSDAKRRTYSPHPVRKTWTNAGEDGQPAGHPDTGRNCARD